MNSSSVKLSWKSGEVSPEIAMLLTTLADEYPVSEGGRGLKLKFEKIESAESVCRVSRSKGEVKIG